MESANSGYFVSLSEVVVAIHHGEIAVSCGVIFCMYSRFKDSGRLTSLSSYEV